MATTLRTLALAALLLCAACGNSTNAIRADNNGAIQISSIRWDEAIAAKEVAHVTNGNLIFMR